MNNYSRLVGLGHYHYAKVPDVDTIIPTSADNDFGSAVVVRLDGMDKGVSSIVHFLCETKVGYSRSHDWRQERTKVVF